MRLIRSKEVIIDYIHTMGDEREAATLALSSLSWSKPILSACCST